MTWVDVLAAATAIRDAAAARDGAIASLPVKAVAWATVEADRAFDELASIGDGTWHSIDRDPLLGAARWRRSPAPQPGIDLLVIEPDTEGRLAACLARFGEGVAAVELAGEGTAAADRIVPVNPRWGPYAIVRDGQGGAPLSRPR
jgi:hypothetical protein